MLIFLRPTKKYLPYAKKARKIGPSGKAVAGIDMRQEISPPQLNPLRCLFHAPVKQKIYRGLTG